MTTKKLLSEIRKFSISESSAPSTVPGDTNEYYTFHFKNGYSACVSINKESVGGYGKYHMIPLNPKGTVDFSVKLDVAFTSAEAVLDASRRVSKLKKETPFIKALKHVIGIS